VIVRALKARFNQGTDRKNFVLRPLKFFSATKEISAAVHQYLVERANKFPGTFFIFQGYVNSYTYFPKENHSNKNQHHCNCVDIASDKWFEPYISDGIVHEGEKTVVFSRSIEVNEPYLIGGSEQNRWYRSILAIREFRIDMENGCEEQCVTDKFVLQN
jgi:hypothetical protein